MKRKPSMLRKHGSQGKSSPNLQPRFTVLYRDTIIDGLEPGSPKSNRPSAEWIFRNLAKTMLINLGAKDRDLPAAVLALLSGGKKARRK